MDETKGRKNFGLMRKKNIIISLIIIICLCIGGFYVYKIFGNKKAVAETNTVTVAKGDISVTISGTGTIEPIDKYEVTSLVKGDILAAPFEEGQIVQKGDLMYKIDTKDIENSIEKSKIALEKSELSNEQNAKALSDLNIMSSISGTITQVYVKEGDNVNSGAKIADVINNEYMLVKIPFNSYDTSNIYIGQTANVTLQNSFYKADGVVEKISSGELVNSTGVAVKYVEIKVANPGAIVPGDKATAVINNVACNSEGSFEYYKSETITSKSSGTLNSFNLSIGDKVTSGAIVAKLDSDTAKNQYAQSQLSIQDSKLSLENMNDQVESYNITAPITGTVITKTSKSGDKLDTSNTKVVMAVIADLSKLVFTINIDELDIAKIKVGQAVSITADALPNKNFLGYIDNISVSGTSQNGVTSYPVRVVVEDSKELIPGMNVNAQIVIDSKQNVLTVPVSAVNRGNIVVVKDSSAKKPNGTQKGNRKNENPNANASDTANPNANTKKTGKTASAITVPDGYKTVKVQVGLNNKENIEILSGLNEGDIVLLPTVKTSSSTNSMPIGGMGGIGGNPMYSGASQSAAKKGGN